MLSYFNRKIVSKLVNLCPVPADVALEYEAVWLMDCQTKPEKPVSPSIEGCLSKVVDVLHGSRLNKKLLFQDLRTKVFPTVRKTKFIKDFIDEVCVKEEFI